MPWWSWQTGSWGRTPQVCFPGQRWWASWLGDPSLPEDSRLEGPGVCCIRSPQARLHKQHAKKRGREWKTRWKTALSGQTLTNYTRDRLSHRQISQYRITETFPNMDIKFPTCWTFLRETVQRAPACPGSALSFLVQHQTERVEMKTPQLWAGVFLL